MDDFATLQGTYRVAELTGAPSLGDRPAFLTLDGDGQVYGMSGVNRVRGTYTLEAGRLTFGPLASTMMAGPAEALQAEQALQALLGVPLELESDDDGALVLRADDGRCLRLVADPQVGDPPAL